MTIILYPPFGKHKTYKNVSFVSTTLQGSLDFTHRLGDATEERISTTLKYLLVGRGAADFASGSPLHRLGDH